ncbi:unnamed protein product [Knipowitschia caucasica]
MSLSGGTAGGKAGVDSNAVDTYDSGDEWDIGVGNLIIDLDADLEKDKLEMSGTKDGLSAPANAVASLPDNIRFVSPVTQGKESKSKYKRSKNSKENSNKAASADMAKKDAAARTQPETIVAANNSTSKGVEKTAKASRGMVGGKKDKDTGKGKKDKGDEKEPLLGNSRAFESAQSAELQDTSPMGNISHDTVGIVPVLKVEQDEVENGECKTLKKVKSEKMESPVSTPAPPPLHLLSAGSEISSTCEQIMVRSRSVAVNTSDVALSTEPECLGPCEPGTSVNLEGIVWQETEDGMLVVNVTWRNKTYVGTLLDCTRHDWAPPRFCESPTSDLEMRNGRGRGKRMRPNPNPPINDNSNSSDSKGAANNNKTRGASNSKGRRGSQTPSDRRTPPNSNAEEVKASPSPAGKRKTKPTSDMEPNSSSEDSKGNKRMRTNSNNGVALAVHLPIIKAEPLPPLVDRTCPSPVLIDCPHPNCNKKYKHINGLKYHQARAHNDDDVKSELDGDSEYGEDSTLHPEPGSCNGASISQKGCMSPARSVTPKGRGFEAQSPSPGKFGSKKKKAADVETEAMDGCEDGACLTDEASNDGLDDKRGGKKPGGKADKLAQKNMKSPRPIPPGSQQMYAFPPGNPAPASVVAPIVQGIPKSPPMKGAPPKLPVVADSPSSNSKDKKKKKKKEGLKEAESPKPAGKGIKTEDGKIPFPDPCELGGAKGDGLLNGSSDPHQSRLASIKAEADKIYSFSDNAPSPSIGVASRIDGVPLTPGQNGADNASVKTNSPAYSDISDAGEDAEGKLEGVKSKTDEQGIREGVKKALFPSQPSSKESPYYAGYDAYYSPNYVNPSPGGPIQGSPAAEGPVKLKREDNQEQEPIEDKVKVEILEDRKPDPQQQQQQQQQPSVIQQRSNMYMQPLYYNQYAYVPPYAYHPDQAYHNHLLSTNPAYRQQCEERQRMMVEQHRANEKKDKDRESYREASVKEEWKQKVKSEQGKSKSRDSPSEAKAMSAGSKADDPKAPQADLLKVKLEGAHHGKDEPRAQAGVEQWYRQQFNETQKASLEEEQQQQQQQPPRWKEERDRDRDRERERKLKEERSRPKDCPGAAKDEPKDGEREEPPRPVKDSRPSPHMQYSLAQHQGYMPYMHGYPYGQAFEPSHPGYRGVPSVMVPNYPGSYLPGAYPFSPYAGKIVSGEEGSEKSGASPTVTKAADSKALDILHQHATQYKSKSPTVGDKAGHERGDRDTERGDRDMDRPRSSPSQRMVPSHHHLGYPLLSAQYDLSYSTGKPDRHTSTLQRFM